MFATQLRSGSLASRARFGWVRRVDGLVRTPIFDTRSSDRAFVVVYDEKRRSYQVEAFQSTNGAPLWSSVVPNGGYGAPAVRNDQLLVISGFTDITALDTSTGRQLWSFATKSRIRSPINVVDDLVIFSSGGQLLALDGEGQSRFQAYLPGVFFFGLCSEGPKNSFLSLGTYHSRDGESWLALFAFERSGRLRWSRDLVNGDIASSDTAGILVHKGFAYSGTVGKLTAVDALTGDLYWESLISGLAHRSICTTNGTHLYTTTVEGDVAAFDLQTGELQWTRHLADEGIWMPVTIIGDRLVLEAGGMLQILDSVTGTCFQEIAVGHCPYSACTVRDNTILLGGGDPPYFGLLFAFHFSSEPEVGLRCFLERESFRPSPDESIDLTVTISGIPELVNTVTMDLSSIGGEPESPPNQRAGNTFIFTVHPGPGRRWGVYALPVRIQLEGNSVWTTVRLDLRMPDALPESVLLTDIPLVLQEAPNFSGAACIQTLRALYGDEVEQKDIREMVDKILANAPGYSPFQIWRIIARRALLTSAHTLDELPEFR